MRGVRGRGRGRVYQGKSTIRQSVANVLGRLRLQGRLASSRAALEGLRGQAGRQAGSLEP